MYATQNISHTRQFPRAHSCRLHAGREDNILVAVGKIYVQLAIFSTDGSLFWDIRNARMTISPPNIVLVCECARIYFKCQNWRPTRESNFFSWEQPFAEHKRNLVPSSVCLWKHRIFRLKLYNKRARVLIASGTVLAHSRVVWLHISFTHKCTYNGLEIRRWGKDPKAIA